MLLLLKLQIFRNAQKSCRPCNLKSALIPILKSISLLFSTSEESLYSQFLFKWSINNLIAGTHFVVNLSPASVTNLKVLAGWFERALVAGCFLRWALAGRGLLQVQGEGRSRLLLRLRLAAPLRLGVAGRGRRPAAGGHRRRGFVGLRRSSLSCEGAQIDLHSH